MQRTQRPASCFGLASQVLAARDGCTADACDAFGLVYDDKKLRANMKDRLFDITVGRYAVNWPTRGRPLASSNSGGVTAPGPNATFPSSQPVPPANVMNSEPPPQNASPAQAAAPDGAPPTNTAPASATKRSPPPPPRAAAKNGPAPPMSLNPAVK